MVRIKNITRKIIAMEIVLYLLSFCVILLLRSVYMWSLASLNEGHYLAINVLLDHGYRLYIDIPDNKPPLFYLINYIIYKVIDNHVFYFRLIMVALAAATALIIYKFVSLVYNQYVGLTSLLIFSLGVSSPWLFNYSLQTHTYCALFVALAIYHLFIALKELSYMNLFISGLFFSLASLTRHTGLVIALFILISILLSKHKRREISMRKTFGYFVLGILLPAFLTMLVLLLYYHIDLFIVADRLLYTIKAKLYSDAQIEWSSFITHERKIRMFTDIVYALLPLWFLLGVAIISNPKLKKDSNNSLRHVVDLAMKIWLIGLTCLIIFGPVPGYHGYYYDILIPLSILSAIGVCRLYRISIFIHRLNRIYRLLFALSLFTSLILTLPIAIVKNTTNPDIVPGQNDFEIISKTVKFVESRTLPNDRIFVWEKGAPKIGPYIYALSKRAPPAPFTFLFPYANKRNIERVIDGLKRYNVTYIIVIDTNKSVFNQWILHEYITTHYVLLSTLDNVKIYEWGPLQTIKVYKRFHVDKPLLDLKSSLLAIAKKNTEVTYEYSRDYIALFARYNGTGWLSLLYRLKDYVNLTEENLALMFKIHLRCNSKPYHELLLHIDLVDVNGKWSRVTFHLSNATYTIPLKSYLLKNIDYETITRIHISIERKDKTEVLCCEIILTHPKIVRINFN